MAKDLTLKFKVTDEGTVVLDKINQKIAGIDETAKKMNSSLSFIKLDSLINLGQRAYNAGKGMYDLTKNIAEAGSEIQRNARLVGMGAEEWQRWAFAAKMSDVEIGSLSAAMRMLSKNMEETSQGTGEAKKYFDAMGISVKDASGNLKPLATIMKEIATQFSTWEDGPRKIAIAMALMGRSAADVIPLFNQSADGIEALGKKASVASDQVLETASKWEEKFKLWEDRWKSWKFSALSAMDEVIEAVKKNRELFAGLEFSLATGVKKKVETSEYSQYEPGPYYPTVAAPQIGAVVAEEMEEPRWIKKWADYQVAEFQKLERAYSALGITSTKSLENAAKDAMDYVKTVEKMAARGEASAQDLINAYDRAAEAMKKLPMTAAQVAKEMEAIEGNKTQSLLSLEEDYQEKMRSIGQDDPDRAKKIQKVIDDWIAAKNKIVDIADKAKVELRAKTNVDEARKTLNDLIKEYTGKVIEMKATVTTSEAGSTIFGGTSTPTNLSEWAEAAGKAIGGVSSQMGDLNDSFQDWSQQWGQGLDVPVSFYGIGSTKKPIIDKIREIIGEFGSLENAMNEIELEINLSQITRQYKDLEEQLHKVNRVLPDISNVISWTGGSWYTQGPSTQYMQEIARTQQDLTEQMRLLDLQRQQEILSYYSASSYQSGIQYVPKTGPAIVHEGEKIVPKNVRSDLNVTFVINGGDPKETARQIEKILKYRVSGSLQDAIKGL